MSEPEKKGLGDLERHAADKAREERLEKLRKMPTYVVRSAKEVLEANPTPPTEIWGGIYLNNDINQIVGQSGVGKSRIMLDLAVRQCLADTQPEVCDKLGNVIAPEFAGLPLYRGEVKWLLIGTENDINRYHQDLRRMTVSCTPEQIDILHKRLFMMTLEGEGDTYIAIDGDEGEQGGNFTKLQALVAQIMPDIVVFDPWGDVIGGSELDDRVVRDTIAVLRKLKKGIKDQMAIVIVNHSRNGVGEAAKATGLDAANFGKNSKALYTISRCVWNLTFLENDLNSKLVGFVNAKRSNGEKYTSRAVRLNTDYMTYDTVHHLDVDQALRDLKSEATKPEQNKTEVRAKQYEDDSNKAIEEVKKALETGKKTRAYLEAKVKAAGCAVRNVDGILAVLMEEHGYKSISDPYDKKTYFGTEKDIANYAAELEKIKSAKEAEKASKQPKKRGRPPKNKPTEK